MCRRDIAMLVVLCCAFSSLAAIGSDKMTKDHLLRFLSVHRDEFVADRHYFHAHPELSYEEEGTSSYIVKRLKRFGYTDIQTKVGKTGVVATLHTGKPGKVVALRADMDALPIQEESSLKYRSKNKGVMHACGHDGHMAVLLLVAKALQHYKQDLSGTIKLIFQPAEEGGKGAQKMIEAGVLQHPKVDAIFGLHGWVEKPLSVSARPGAMMAGSTIFDIDIKGRGGHAALPHLTVNPIFIGAHILTAFENLMAQKDPTELMVLNITSINSGTTYNVVSDDINLKGTLRTVSSAQESMILSKMQMIIDKTCAIYGCEGKLSPRMSYPATINSLKETQTVLQSAREILDEGQVFTRESAVLPAEDFSLYLERVPGCFFFLGQGDDKPALHSSQFNFNDESIVTGAYVLIRSVLNTLYQ